MRLISVDDAGDVVLEATVRGPGDDATWFTGDDALVDSYTRTERDVFGGVRSTSEFTAGPDGVWFTDDDVRTAYTEFTMVPALSYVLSKYD